MCTLIMQHSPEYDLEELESRLYSQVFHSSENWEQTVDHTVLKKLPEKQISTYSVNNTGPNVNRYWGNETQSKSPLTIIDNTKTSDNASNTAVNTENSKDQLSTICNKSEPLEELILFSKETENESDSQNSENKPCTDIKISNPFNTNSNNCTLQVKQDLIKTDENSPIETNNISNNNNNNSTRDLDKKIRKKLAKKKRKIENKKKKEEARRNRELRKAENLQKRLEKRAKEQNLKSKPILPLMHTLVPPPPEFFSFIHQFNNICRNRYQQNQIQPYQQNQIQPYQQNQIQPYQQNQIQPYQQNQIQPYQQNRIEPYQQNRIEPYQQNQNRTYQQNQIQPYQQVPIYKRKLSKNENSLQIKVIETNQQKSDEIVILSDSDSDSDDVIAIPNPPPQIYNVDSTSDESETEEKAEICASTSQNTVNIEQNKSEEVKIPNSPTPGPSNETEKPKNETEINVVKKLEEGEEKCEISEDNQEKIYQPDDNALIDDKIELKTDETIESTVDKPVENTIVEIEKERAELLCTPDSNTNDFITVDVNNLNRSNLSFNFTLHDSDLDLTGKEMHKTTTSITDIYETESSCSEAGPQTKNKTYFSEVDFESPIKGIFMEPDLDKFSNFITPIRNKDNSLVKSNKQFSPVKTKAKINSEELSSLEHPLDTEENEDNINSDGYNSDATSLQTKKKNKKKKKKPKNKDNSDEQKSEDETLNKNKKGKKKNDKASEEISEKSQKSPKRKENSESDEEISNKNKKGRKKTDISDKKSQKSPKRKEISDSDDETTNKNKKNKRKNEDTPNKQKCISNEDTIKNKKNKTGNQNLDETYTKNKSKKNKKKDISVPEQEIVEPVATSSKEKTPKKKNKLNTSNVESSNPEKLISDSYKNKKEKRKSVQMEEESEITNKKSKKTTNTEKSVPSETSEVSNKRKSENSSQLEHANNETNKKSKKNLNITECNINDKSSEEINIDAGPSNEITKISENQNNENSSDNLDPVVEYYEKLDTYFADDILCQELEEDVMPKTSSPILENEDAQNTLEVIQKSENDIENNQSIDKPEINTETAQTFSFLGTFQKSTQSSIKPDKIIDDLTINISSDSDSDNEIEIIEHRSPIIEIQSPINESSSSNLATNLVLNVFSNTNESSTSGTNQNIVANPFSFVKNFEQFNKDKKSFKDFWTLDMNTFYNQSWGQENYDLNKVILSMPSESSKWRIEPADVFNIKSRKKGKICLRCREFGHMQINCKKNTSIIICSTCGDPGHTHTRCPKSICTTCRSGTQHHTSSCHNCINYRNLRCPICKYIGHLPSDCPDLWRRYHLTTNESNNLVVPEQQMKHPNKLWCSNCANRGHSSNNCNHLRTEHFETNPIIQNYAAVYNKSPIIPEVTHEPNIPVRIFENVKLSDIRNYKTQLVSNNNKKYLNMIRKLKQRIDKSDFYINNRLNYLQNAVNDNRFDGKKVGELYKLKSRIDKNKR